MGIIQTKYLSPLNYCMQSVHSRIPSGIIVMDRRYLSSISYPQIPTLLLFGCINNIIGRILDNVIMIMIDSISAIYQDGEGL